MSVLKDVQSAVIGYLRKDIALVGDYLPDDNEYKQFVHLAQTEINDLSNKKDKRYTVSFIFHILCEMGNSNDYLDLVDKVTSLEDAEIEMNSYSVDNIKITAQTSFVDKQLNKTIRHAVVHFDIDVTKIN